MTTSAPWALQKGIYQTLVDDALLTGLLGGPKIYDRVPRQAGFPYVTFGQSVTRDWSTGGADGQEHVVTLHVWSRGGGKQETHAILDRVRDLLHDQALPLTDHRLVNLRHEFGEARQDADGETYHGIARYRAVTEPAG